MRIVGVFESSISSDVNIILHTMVAIHNKARKICTNTFAGIIGRRTHRLI